MQAVQLSMFDEPEELLFTKAVKRGSGYENGKERIALAAEILDSKRLAEYLKAEYGIGGFMMKGLWVDYDAKGFAVGTCSKDLQTYSWKKVAKEIRRLVALNKYLD